MKDGFQISISAPGPSIGEQLQKLNIKPSGMTVEQIDTMSRDLTRAHIWGLLTDAEVNRARQRLLKRAKFVKAWKA
jgi:hypothetical protein